VRYRADPIGGKIRGGRRQTEYGCTEFNSLNALRHEPSASNNAIRLEPDLADAEISGSAVTANALILHDLTTRPLANVDRDGDRLML
jgi:hypothetical protein